MTGINLNNIKSTYVRILCTIGIILSCYALYVEHKTHDKFNDKNTSIHNGSTLFPIKEEDEFKALCDIEAIGASCR